MIHYQLRCTSTAEEHAFDGWYRDSAAFETLAKASLLDCPVCGGTQVSRALMAPAIPKKGRPARNAIEAAPPPVPVPAPAPEPPSEAPAATAGPMPAQVRAMLQKLRAEVERNCDYVGADFAEEARRMERGETERRGIFGEASEAEAEALREDGIEVARIPWVPPADA
ncbi:DUF1178 family protein [Roseomonas sp. CECT 9278]|uniref:DUF1178 family protein n=1 Tax=Roseomonas sp. CECT 9278 TaxID=2845823 RepID=UPI001E5161A4|nr:DUF1178 family protein [Roseomonas sp. CECT 9278]CAH0167159.1 hypothetical protein ROS9278_01103 [Roseomonas sp. CECT 9278]